jgi:hypothetical protein
MGILILLSVLNGRKIWPLALGEHWLMVLKNRVLRKKAVAKEVGRKTKLE